MLHEPKSCRAVISCSWARRSFIRAEATTIYFTPMNDALFKWLANGCSAKSRSSANTELIPKVSEKVENVPIRGLKNIEFGAASRKTTLTASLHCAPRYEVKDGTSTAFP